MPSSLDVDFATVQAHYDLSDDFFRLFLDPSLTYSCARFARPDMSLAEAQRTKIDTTLDKCELQTGQRLLDIGCGWGATALRAHERDRVFVIGLTLSQNQFAHNQKLAAGRPGLEFRLEGWETFMEPVERIVSIGAFEHFGRAKYGDFFARCRALLPGDGVLLLHTITLGKKSKSFAFLRFVHFLSTKIFPGGDVPPPERVLEAARFADLEAVHIESLRPHYARTLEHWAQNLVRNAECANAIVGEETYQTYLKYLTGCASYFRGGECDIYQFKFRPV
jgi:cyclopropane-fatty-acyl-phospholipid synthase